MAPLLLLTIFSCGQPYNNKFIYNITIYYYHLSNISMTEYLHTWALGEWTVVSVTILLGDTDITLLYNKSATQICILSFTDLEEVSRFMISSGIKQEWDDRCVNLVEPSMLRTTICGFNLWESGFPSSANY